MGCERFHKLMSISVDGELTDDDSCLLRNHLDECQSCGQMLETIMEQSLLLACSRVPDHQVDLRSRVKERIGLISHDVQEPWYFGHILEFPPPRHHRELALTPPLSADLCAGPCTGGV